MIKEVYGNIVNVERGEIFSGKILIENGVISRISKISRNFKEYIIPGFLDSHIHIESSMLMPSEFARIASIHGTIGVLADPHEIANVLGIKGIYYLIDNASKVPFKFFFGAPSCVPASPFESSGSKVGLKELEELLGKRDIKFLAEVMNYPGVVEGEEEILKKIEIAKRYRKPIDGHAPGLTGRRLRKYISAGISTDHECFTIEEAKEKIKLGMKIQIREGSAAKNFDTLYPLLEDYWKNCMFCSDDKHPDDLIKGHINLLVKKAVRNGIDVFKVLKVACKNPIDHYNLEIGLLEEKDPADFIIVDNLKNFNIISTYINGIEVARKGKSFIKRVKPIIKNKFVTKVKKEEDFHLKCKGKMINVIVAIDGEIITEREKVQAKIINNLIESDKERDVLKITVVNRYANTKPSVAFIKGFGLKKGAIASSISHDSHNIVCVGVDNRDICRAVNTIIRNKGGICAVYKDKKIFLHLPIAGIISNSKYTLVARKYRELNKMARIFSCKLKAPFMTLSFMGLTVIPKLKLSDKGLFDSENFKFINVCE